MVAVCVVVVVAFFHCFSFHEGLKPNEFLSLSAVFHRDSVKRRRLRTENR